MRFPATDIEHAMQAEIDALKAERDAAISQRDEWQACFLSMRAERDELLKDRADLAKQIDNDTNCIAKLKEADGLDVLPTLAAAYKENATLVERVSVLEKALEKIERNVTGDIRVVIEIARAALSEDAK